MASRFSNGSERQAISRSARASYSPWVQVRDLGCLEDSRRSGRKRIFAAVSRPIPTGVEGKTIRHILIFDNHPDSLRLVFESGTDLDSDIAAWQRERRTSVICGSILIALVLAAMLWPLLW
jgi:hypothetical protein